MGVFSFSGNDMMGAGWCLDEGVACVLFQGLLTNFPYMYHTVHYLSASSLLLGIVFA